LLCEALEIAAPAPDGMIGSLAAVPIPDGAPAPPTSPLYGDPLQDALREEAGIEVPIVPWPGAPRRLIRISAAAYNTIEDYERLALAFPVLLRR
jgi:isopenicillin-N epimerase